MPSLLLVVFLLQLAIHLVNTFGAAFVNELLWFLYNKLPTPTSAAAQKSAVLKRDVIRLKREMNAVSAQDDFARWAKLRRQHDKALAEYEKASGSLTSAKSNFDKAAGGLRWIGTNGMRTVLQFWFTKSAMFWLPKGWLPGYAEWILSFPRAPTGSISIQVWAIACGSIIRLVHSAVVAGYALVLGAAAIKTEEPQAFPAEQRETAAARPGRKEL